MKLIIFIKFLFYILIIKLYYDFIEIVIGGNKIVNWFLINEF